MTGETGSIVAGIEAAAAARYSRWDAALWRALVEGPATRLSRGLHASGAPAIEADALLGSYLRLGAEAIGLGYLVPTGSSGADTFLSHAWQTLLPAHLPHTPAGRRAERLAQCWNLGETHEHEPAWLQRIFLLRLPTLRDLEGLEALVADVSGKVLEEPTTALGTRLRPVWIWLGAHDRWFLPGEVRFVAPTVVCVRDRLRPDVSVGVWLTETPALLGPMTPPEEPGGEPSEWPWESVRAADPRLTGVHASIRNRWRAVATLTTSQYLVVALPEAP